MTSHRLPWRVDEWAGWLATVGLSWAADRVGVPTLVGSVDGHATMTSSPDVLADALARSGLWDRIAGNRSESVELSTRAAWEALTGEGDEWAAALAWPSAGRPKMKETAGSKAARKAAKDAGEDVPPAVLDEVVAVHPMFRALAGQGSVAKRTADLLAVVDWPTALAGAGQRHLLHPGPDGSLTPAGWDIEAVRLPGRGGYAVLRPAVELLATCAVHMVRGDVGWDPPGWHPRCGPAGAWSWPVWTEPMDLHAVRWTIDSDWRRRVAGDGRVTGDLHAASAAGVTLMWAPTEILNATLGQRSGNGVVPVVGRARPCERSGARPKPGERSHPVQTTIPGR